jgi:ribosomal protein S18 acetylase RimI-like enzyme
MVHNNTNVMKQEVSAIYNYAEIIIRRAELSEVDDVKAIIQEAYKDVKKQLSRTPAALQEGLGKIARHIQMGDQYVAIIGNTIVGTMRVKLRGQVGVVSRMAVLEKFRSRRIGTMLLEYAENLLTRNNATCIEIEVYGRIDAQLSFYEKFGYSETNRLTREGEEIVVMQKDLCAKDVEEEEVL